MNKTIEKIEAYKTKELEKAIAKAKQGYEEARDFYNDTGYDRYYNKMNKCEAELQELKDYLHKDKVVVEKLSTNEYKEYFKMKQDLQSLKSKLFYLVKDLGLPATAELVSMQDIFKDYSYLN